MEKIIVVPYDKKWKSEFEKAAKFYEGILQNIDIKIEHVGSTSVEGLWAKPILDIDIIVGNSSDSKKVIEALSSVGYIHVGDYGVPGREAFKYLEDNEYVDWMTHHLYVCLDGTENLTNHLLLRKHLRKNKDAVEAYGAIKRELANKYPDDIHSYIDGKTELITKFLEAEGMDTVALKRITTINTKTEK